ncbi:hypothetical protein C4573_04895 [Candidatus Woesearchaeota archaeon]|nr:MAG: hypothetical protein C4573_04895 [Candidatus Woesearchaeota archaeon]
MKYVFIAMVALLLLTACTSTTKQPSSFNPYKGPYGLKTEFMKNAPPAKIFQEEDFNVIVKVQNAGAFNISKDEKTEGYLYFIYDSYYFTLNGSEEPTEIELPGKHYFNQEGSLETYSYLFHARTIEGQRESPSSKILMNVCYPYTTKLTADVCIDKDPFNLDARKKSCSAKLLTFANQGAPVAITRVEPRMTVSDNRVTPSFAITLKNVGGGTMIQKTEQSIQQQCVLKESPTQLWGKLIINASLFNRPLDCNPNPVNFMNNEGTVNCKLIGDPLELTFISQPDILTIQTDYLYFQTSSKDVQIVR